MDNIWFQTIKDVAVTIQSKIIHFVGVLPEVSGAILIFVYGFVLAEVAYRAILALSKKLRLELISEKIGLSHYLRAKGSKTSASRLIAHAAKGFLIFFFFMEATRILGFTQVTEFLEEVMGYIPNVIIAIFIMLVGLRVAETVEVLIRTSLSFTNDHTSNILGMAGRYTVFTFAILAALSQLEIAEILINSLFIGFVSMLALAGGLAFGLGGKDVVKQLLESVKRIEMKRKK